MADEEEEFYETLTLQLTEIEILSSMFVEEKELSVDQAALAEIQDYVSGITTDKPKKLSFSLWLSSVQEAKNSGKENALEVNCYYPLRYPHDLPNVYVKCNALTRELQKELNESTTTFLSGLSLGELCVVTLIQWLQENWPEFYERNRRELENKKDKKSETKEVKKEIKLCRIWLYMHHIYNKNKRKNIIDWALEAKLNGFSLPGKPGVVCVEGDERDAEEYFCRLRRLSWKKITCRHREHGLNQPCFHDFQELVYRVQGNGEDRMSMGDFFQYLVKHDLGEMFKVLFGVDGKLNHDS